MRRRKYYDPGAHPFPHNTGRTTMYRGARAIDGHDDARIAAAKAKRERRAAMRRQNDIERFKGEVSAMFALRLAGAKVRPAARKRWGWTR
jgi:hypothetical protein